MVLQVFKQLRRNPRPASHRRGVVLLFVLLSSFPVSSELLDCLEPMLYSVASALHCLSAHSTLRRWAALSDGSAATPSRLPRVKEVSEVLSLGQKLHDAGWLSPAARGPSSSAPQQRWALLVFDPVASAYAPLPLTQGLHHLLREAATTSRGADALKLDAPVRSISLTHPHASGVTVAEALALSE